MVRVIFSMFGLQVEGEVKLGKLCGKEDHTHLQRRKTHTHTHAFSNSDLFQNCFWLCLDGNVNMRRRRSVCFHHAMQLSAALLFSHSAAVQMCSHFIFSFHAGSIPAPLWLQLRLSSFLLFKPSWSVSPRNMQWWILTIPISIPNSLLWFEMSAFCLILSWICFN